MHWPQYPYAYGWDVQARPPLFLADDFLCTASGPVADIHIWGSFQADMEGPIVNVHASIHENIPADHVGFSQPGEVLWQRDFGPGEFVVVPRGEGLRGWIDPLGGVVIPDDHQLSWQINITNIPDPFVQEQGTTYWLDIQVDSLDSLFGWQTSVDGWGDDAVYGLGDPVVWQPLFDPITNESLDFAFVITVPEPATLVLLSLGGLLVLRHCARRQMRSPRRQKR
jgi:hypothetical protein